MANKYLPNWIKKKLGQPKIYEEAHNLDVDVDVDTIFQDPEKHSNRALHSVFFLTAILIFASVYLKYTQFKLSVCNTPPISNECDSIWNFASISMDSLVAIFLSVFASILASLLAVKYINTRNIGRLKYIHKMGHRVYLKELFSLLTSLNGKYTEDKHITIKVEKIKDFGEDKKFLVCNITTRQRTILNEGSFKFKLNLIHGSEEVIEDLETKERVDDFFTLDIDYIEASTQDWKEYFTVPVVTVASEIFASKEHVDFSTLLSNGENSDTVPQTVKNSEGKTPSLGDGGAGRNPLVCTKVQGPKSSFIFSTATDDSAPNELVDVSWSYNMLLELPGYSWFGMDEPTRGFVCTMDYTSVVDEINVYMDQLIDARKFRKDRNNKNGIKVVSHKGWIMRNSLVMLHWYPRRKKTNQDVPETHSGTDANA